MKDSIKNLFPLMIDLIEENWEYSVNRLIDSGRTPDDANGQLSRAIDDLYKELNK